MKYTIAGLLLAMAIVTFAQTQKNPPGQGAEATKQVLIKLENKWVEALVKSDAAALDAIFADTYVDTDEHSHRTDRQGVLSVLRSGDLKMESIKLSDLQVHDYGDAAIVVGNARQVGNFKGQSITATIAFTDTFIRQNGKWKAVASHRSVV